MNRSNQELAQDLRRHAIAIQQKQGTGNCDKNTRHLFCGLIS